MPDPAQARVLANGRGSWALSQAFREGYTLERLRSDILAGIVVGIIALPLSMALAIASGVPPQYGIYTGIVAGAVAASLGGSRTLVTGPTAAFVVILVPIASRFGLGGLLLATVMAGLILIVLGVARLGRLIQYIPYPVTTGFTAGIAVVIAVGQVRDFLGLSVASTPERFVERAVALARALPTTHVPDLIIGGLTLTLLILGPRITKRIPAPLIALTVAALAAPAIAALVQNFDVATIGTKFSHLADGVARRGIPAVAPTFLLPWRLPGPDGRPLGLSLALVHDLAPSAMAIAMLGAIESLLAAVVADGMVGTRHDPNRELIAQGAGNLLAPFFGGFAATGAIARTASNIRAGGRSPVAALTHAVFMLAAVLAMAPLLSYLPLAALAALLLVVAWNMSEVKHVRSVLRVAPRSDATVLVTCLTLTVLFDMVVAVAVGVMLAGLLFMRRMAEISGATLVEGAHPDLAEPLPRDVLLYEVAGPLFFGAAQRAMSSLHAIESRAKVVILDMEAVPVMDATGLVNLESAIEALHRDGITVVLAGVRRQPMELLERAGFQDDGNRLLIRDTLVEAVAAATGAVTR